MTNKDCWDKMEWQAKERFLSVRGFCLGLSSHTWKYLPREIQAAFEVR